MTDIPDQSNETRVLTAALCIEVRPGISANMLIEVASRAIAEALGKDKQFFCAAKSLESISMTEAYARHDKGVDAYHDLQKEEL
jgi:hypothetical protein